MKQRPRIYYSDAQKELMWDRMKSDYGEALTPSALSHSITRGTLSLQRALQILAISGVSEVEIKG